MDRRTRLSAIDDLKVCEARHDGSAASILNLNSLRGRSDALAISEKHKGIFPIFFLILLFTSPRA